MTIDKTTTAFPTLPELNSGAPGVTLRDYFAAKAMQAYCTEYPDNKTATYAYRLADEMIKVRDA